MQKPSCPVGKDGFGGCNYYCFFSFVGSLVAPLEEELLLGEVELDELGAVVELAPPAALSFFVESLVAALEDEDDGGVLLLGALAEPETDPDAEPDGVLGVVVEPDEDDDAEPDGVLGVLDGVVVVLRETARSPFLSQPVSMLAPSARDTATAKVVNLIVWASVGWGENNGARFRPDTLRS